jgi:hypothetical protein
LQLQICDASIVLLADKYYVSNYTCYSGFLSTVGIRILVTPAFAEVLPLNLFSGPMLSSGMCTEVFQFDVSPSYHANGIVPGHSNAMSNSSSSQNFTENLPARRPHKNRRILYSEAIPLRGSTSNDTEHLKAHTKNESYARSKPVSSVVVSVLADPREAGDGNSDGRTSSKSLSRIFVVVLIDSVKYVTYSCVLPFKYHSPHL